MKMTAKTACGTKTGHASAGKIHPIVIYPFKQPGHYSDLEALYGLVSRLAAEVSFAAARDWRLGRLDDVARGRLGGVGGVFREAGHLGRQFGHLRRELSDELFQLGDACLIGLFRHLIHGWPTRPINV